uniref:Battenin n=1 Tax=Lygus hesperus TaxID=30085 RepID=A0A146L4E2_LYGHE
MERARLLSTEPSETDSDSDEIKRMSPGDLPIRQRSVTAYWLLGLCNNYGYVVMLSAAVDIIKSTTSGESTLSANQTLNDANPGRNCTEMSTGAILLADIIPSLLIKIVAPFFPQLINIRVAIIVLLNALGFILVSQAKTIFMAITGVVTLAFGSGLGETSLLAHMAQYKNRRILSSWSSGTGAAGLCGAGSYMLLSYLSGDNRSQPLLIFLVVPVVMGIAFWMLLERPVVPGLSGTAQENNATGSPGTAHEDNATSLPGTGYENSATSLSETAYEDNVIDVCQAGSSSDMIDNTSEEFNPTIMDKVRAVPGLLKYMLPFGLVYLFEYFINQGLQELITFDYSWITTDNQYVSYQLLYQTGVFFSRSSIGLFRVHNTWALALLQAINVVLLGADAVYRFIPSIYIIWALILWEGCLGGLSYVNTYDRINHEVPVEQRDFSMAINSFGDAVGISIAGVLAIPAHNFICSLPV